MQIVYLFHIAFLNCKGGYFKSKLRVYFKISEAVRLDIDIDIGLIYIFS